MVPDTIILPTFTPKMNKMELKLLPILRRIFVGSSWVVGRNFVVVSYPGYEERTKVIPKSLLVCMRHTKVLSHLSSCSVIFNFVLK